jgi:hypothetical protein
MYSFFDFLYKTFYLCIEFLNFYTYASLGIDEIAFIG